MCYVFSFTYSGIVLVDTTYINVMVLLVWESNGMIQYPISNTSRITDTHVVYLCIHIPYIYISKTCILIKPVFLISQVATVVVSTSLHGASSYWLLWGACLLGGLCGERWLAARYEWYRRPNWFIRAINQWVVWVANIFPFDKFPPHAFSAIAWVCLAFLLLTELWGSFGGNTRY